MDQRLNRKRQTASKSRGTKTAAVVAVLGSSITPSGRKSWRVKLADGSEKVLRAKPSSEAAAERAAKRFAAALRRLADR
jgi:hypothetical protein